MRVACSGRDMRSKGGWIALGDLGSGRWTGLEKDTDAAHSQLLKYCSVEERRGLEVGASGVPKGQEGPLREAPALGTLLHCSHGLELGWASLSHTPSCGLDVGWG